MKYFGTFILLIALLAQHYSRYTVMLNYALNKDYIAKNLCVNKSKPKMNCNGKCYLKKQLAKAEKEQNTPGTTNNLKEKSTELFLSTQQLHTVWFFAEEQVSCVALNHQVFIPTGYNAALLKPPTA